MEPTWITFDDEYRIVDAVGGYATFHQDKVGRVVWEDWPDSQPLFQPIYDEAFLVGYAYRMVPYRGNIVEVHANRCDGRLRVCLTGWTLNGLRQAIADLEAALEASQASA